jgi:hypothetical protein
MNMPGLEEMYAERVIRHVKTIVLFMRLLSYEKGILYIRGSFFIDSHEKFPLPSLQRQLFIRS